MATTTGSAVDERLISALQQHLKGAGGFAPKKEILTIAVALARDPSLVAGTVCKQATPPISSSGTRKRIIEYKERIVNERLLEKYAENLDEQQQLPDLSEPPFGLSENLLLHSEWIALHAPSLDEIWVDDLQLAHRTESGEYISPEELEQEHGTDTSGSAQAGPLCAVRWLAAKRSECYMDRKCPTCDASLELIRLQPKEGESNEDRLAEVAAAQQFWRTEERADPITGTWLQSWVRQGSALIDASLADSTPYTDPFDEASFGFRGVVAPYPSAHGWEEGQCPCDFCAKQQGMPDAARPVPGQVPNPWAGPHAFNRAFFDAATLNRAVENARSGLLTPEVMDAMAAERSAMATLHAASPAKYWSLDPGENAAMMDALEPLEAALKAAESAMKAALADYLRDTTRECTYCNECWDFWKDGMYLFELPFQSLLPHMCLRWHCSACAYNCCLHCAEHARRVQTFGGEYASNIDTEFMSVEYDLPPASGETKEEQKRRRERHRQREEACIRKLDGIAVEMYRRKRAQAARERFSK